MLHDAVTTLNKDGPDESPKSAVCRQDTRPQVLRFWKIQSTAWHRQASSAQFCACLADCLDKTFAKFAFEDSSLCSALSHLSLFPSNISQAQVVHPRRHLQPILVHSNRLFADQLLLACHITCSNIEPADSAHSYCTNILLLPLISAHAAL